MLTRWPWLSLLALSACVRDVEDHCANQDTPDPDQYCASIEMVGEFCSKCTAEHYGCVADLTTIDPDCRPDGATSVADDGSTDDSATTPMTETTTGDDDSANTSTADVSTDAGASSDTTGQPDPVCGNGVVEGDEVCDGSVGEYDCQSLGHGSKGTLLCDSRTCEYDFSQCSNPAAVCGDGVINTMAEEGKCDMTDFDGADCDSVPGYGVGGGELACTRDCTIDPSACCLDSGQVCTVAADCCSNLCNALVNPKTCLLGS